MAFDEDRRLFDLLNAEAQEAASSGDFDRFRAKLWEAREIGQYHHVVAMSGPAGLIVRSLPPLLARDCDAFFSVSRAVVDEFERTV